MLSYPVILFFWPLETHTQKAEYYSNQAKKVPNEGLPSHTLQSLAFVKLGVRNSFPLMLILRYRKVQRDRNRAAWPHFVEGRPNMAQRSCTIAHPAKSGAGLLLCDRGSEASRDTAAEVLILFLGIYCRCRPQTEIEMHLSGTRFTKPNPRQKKKKNWTGDVLEASRLEQGSPIRRLDWNLPSKCASLKRQKMFMCISRQNLLYECCSCIIAITSGNNPVINANKQKSFTNKQSCSSLMLILLVSPINI